MAAAVRRAEVVWEGDLMSGSGRVSTRSSPALRDQPVSWAARTEDPGGKTSPEELVAAAHASCFSMALSANLAKRRAPPTRLEVTATVTFDKVGAGFKVISSALEVRGTVPGLEGAAFQTAAEEAKEGCPISQMMKGNVELSVKATLAGGA
ncbi:MAG: OsmC family peroxiredoxin [Anaeromyxobacter sp.]